MQIAQATKKTLDSLPFDGSKTKLGFWGTVYGVSAAAFSLPIPTDPVTFIVTTLLTLGVGKLHKWLKKKYPQVIWPTEDQSQSNAL